MSDEDPLGPIVRVLAEILSSPVVLTTDVDESLRAFEREHCLDPRLQPAFTATTLREFVHEMPPRHIHEVEEPLGMAVAIARWDDHMLLIGPYTHETLYPGAAEDLVRGLVLPSGHVSAYKLYRTRYAIVDAEYVYRSAAALLRAAGADDHAGVLQRIKAEGGSIAPGRGEALQSGAFAVVEERYRHEQDFMDAVADGDTDQALTVLQRLAGTQRVSGYLNTPYLGATILRIMARVAAQRGGLPPVTIDAISQEYAQRLHRVGHTSDPKHTHAFSAQMVTDFCQSVHRHRQRDYPLLVRRVIDEIDLHLSRHVSTAAMAENLGVSTSTLARRFHDATGTTIAGYIARRRTERAARLLTTTTQPVRDIAAFVGYDDANYFVKVFRREHGMTPTAYRNLHAR